DVLIFEEVKGPRTGNTADADPSHRWAVRLTSVTCGDAGGALVDPVLPIDALLRNPPLTQLQQITEITWNEEDALPFPLCISSVTDIDHGEQPLDDVSIARGNVILCDHGLSVVESKAASEIVPRPDRALTIADSAGCTCDDRQPDETPVRYR